MWLERLFRRERMERELDKELRYHAERRIDDLVRRECLRGKPPGARVSSLAARRRLKKHAGMRAARDGWKTFCAIAVMGCVSCDEARRSLRSPFFHSRWASGQTQRSSA